MKLLSKKINELTDLVRKRIRATFKTYIGMMGRAIEPLCPLGFDWRLSIGLLSGFPAKEALLAQWECCFRR